MGSMVGVHGPGRGWAHGTGLGRFREGDSPWASTFPLTPAEPSVASFFAHLPWEEQQVLESFWPILEAFDLGDEDGAAPLAHALAHRLEGCLEGRLDGRGRAGAGAFGNASAGANPSPVTPVTQAFLHALQCRAGDRSWRAGNLYSDGRAVGAQARAFENFCREAPLVPTSYRMAQGAMESWVRTQCARHGKRLRLVIVDVGLGRGLHLRGFLENPALASWIEDLRVVGIEPSWAEGPAQRVHQVESDLTQFARTGGVPLAFCPLAAPVEEVDADTLRSWVGSGCDAVLALGSFSLHHTVGPQEGTHPARERVLKTLRRCGAQGLVLTEPDSNHVSSSLRLRFLHSYRHYRILYDALVSYVGPRHAWTLWRDFFGQEVVNILAHEGMHHVERHEDMGTWAQRLVRCGWAVEDLRGEVPALALPAGLQVRGDEKGLRLLFRGEPLVAVLRASSVWH